MLTSPRRFAAICCLLLSQHHRTLTCFCITCICYDGSHTGWVLVRCLLPNFAAARAEIARTPPGRPHTWVHCHNHHTATTTQSPSNIPIATQTQTDTHTANPRSFNTILLRTNKQAQISALTVSLLRTLHRDRRCGRPSCCSGQGHSALESYLPSPPVASHTMRVSLSVARDSCVIAAGKAHFAVI